MSKFGIKPLIINHTTHTLRTLFSHFYFLLLFLSVALPAQELIINEFLASNVRDFPEMYDFGDYNDWIELFNPTDSSVSLENFFLSDDSGYPLKWKFPSGASIAPNEYLIVWADGFNEGPGSSYQRETWPYDDYTTRHYHTNFKLSKSGEDVVLSRANVENSIDFISSESSWKYLDNGSNQLDAWVTSNFDDSGWDEGFAELGYGDGDEATTLNFGPNSDDKYATTYFRKSFNVNDVVGIDQLLIGLKRDDGAVVYLNGMELFRSNMPVGDITWESEASSAASSAEEDTFYAYTLPADDLIPGENILAVEIHQVSGTSSDISFDLNLRGVSYANAQIIDQVTYSQQLTDVSLGRSNNGDAWTYYGEPTVGAPNATPASINMERSTPVTASHVSGFYTGEQTITLGTENTSAQIHYTLDSERPGSTTALYNTPITVSSTSILKARTIEPGTLPGDILSLSILIDESSSLPLISLTAEPPTLWDTDIGIYENEYKQREIPVRVEYFRPDQSLGFEINAGSRLGGMNIWTKPQKPFTIYTRDRFGADQIPYQIFAEKPIADFSRIVFRNGGDDWEETLLRDPMTESLVKGMMDCGYMAYQPASLYLNGEYWGLYNIREKFDKRYFFENFGVDPDNIDHLEYGATAIGTRLMTIEGDLLAYNELINFILSNDLDTPANYAHLQQAMNIDGFIDHVTMTLYCANTSWGHNREWWRSRDPGGKWEWLIVDVDRGFNPSNTNTNLLDNLLDGYLLFQYLMQSQTFENQFLQRAAAHFNNTFALDRVSGIVDSLAAAVRPEMPRQIERWGTSGSVSSMANWEDELDLIKAFASARPSNLFNHFDNELSLDGTVEIGTATYPSEGGHILINGVPQLSANNTGSYFKNRPVRFTAIAAPGWEVVGWSSVSDSAQIDYDCAVDTGFIALFQPNSGSVLPGLITENTTLTSDHPFYVSENLHVPAGVTLTLDPGVEIRMPAQGHIIIDGQLIVNGTPDVPVLIGSNDETDNGRWGGISFSNASDTSSISYLQLSDASRGIDPIIHRGAISGHNAHLRIDHLDIRDVLFPIYIEGGSIELTHSSLRCDYISDFINVKRGVARISENQFFGAGAPDTDAIDLDGVSDGIVSNNRIYNFSGSNSDGIDIGEACQGVIIRSNLIYHASDKGISVGQGSSIIIDKNLIVGCVSGVAIKDESQALISNNTFANNHIAVNCFEKNEGRGGGHATISNSILAGSLVNSISADSYSSIAVNHSLSDTELMPGGGNLMADPLFINSAIYNFELESSSPAIDAGDPEAPLDPDLSPRDMGAYYQYDPNHYPFDIPGAFIYQMKINEFLASNQASNSDESGGFDDWLELYNPTDQPLDLAGLFLSDDPNNMTKWELPEGGSFIEASGFLLVWCDEDQNQGDLHSNFKLSASGEFLSLVAADGLTVIDSLSFGAQITDISYGRIPDGGPEWASTTPTPGSPNNLVDTNPEIAIPTRFVLHQNYPNPFNPSTTISYELPEPGRVELRIYDLRGRLIRTLVEHEQHAGYKHIKWFARDDSGHPVSTGVYFIRLSTPGYSKVVKMVYLD